MTGPRNVDGPRRRLIVLGRVDAHDLVPARVVAVLDHECDRAADRLPAAHAGHDPDLVGLDVLAVAAPEAELAPHRLGVERRDVERQAARDPFDDPDQGGPVRLAGGEVAQAHAGSSFGAKPNQRSNVAAPWATNIAVPVTVRSPRAFASARNGVHSGV